MNIITKIALSLSLITLVAQSAPDINMKQMPDNQATGYKKVGRIVGNTLLTITGAAALMFGSLSAYSVHCISKNIDKASDSIKIEKDRYQRWRKNPDSSYYTHDLTHNSEKRNLEEKLIKRKIGAGICLPTSIVLLYFGTTGLKKEICPNFNPIEWVKNKLGIKTKQTEQTP